MQFLYLTLIAIPFFFMIDMVWLGFIAKSFYAEQLGPLLRPDINWVAAVVFYMIFILWLVLFVISPALEERSWMKALLYGGAFGLVCYATYDLTNLSTLKNWPLLLSLVDMAWGMCLAASVSVITYAIATRFNI